MFLHQVNTCDADFSDVQENQRGFRFILSSCAPVTEHLSTTTGSQVLQSGPFSPESDLDTQRPTVLLFRSASTCH